MKQFLSYASVVLVTAGCTYLITHRDPANVDAPAPAIPAPAKLPPEPVQATKPSASPAPATVPPATSDSKVEWQRLPGESWATFRARLVKSGMPAALVTDYLRAVNELDYQQRIAALGMTGVATNWLRRSEQAARRDEADKLRAAKEQAELEIGVVPRQFALLTPEMFQSTKAVENAAQQQMEEAKRAGLKGLELSAEYQRIQLERIAALRKLLPENAYLDYALKKNFTLAAYAQSLTYFEPTEAEFKGLVALRERPGLAVTELAQATREEIQASVDAQKVFQEDARKLLGEARFQEYTEKANSAYRNRQNVIAEAGLPPEKAKWLAETDRAFREAVNNMTPVGSALEQATVIANFETALRKELGERAYRLYMESFTGTLRFRKHTIMRQAQVQNIKLPEGFTFP